MMCQTRHVAERHVGLCDVAFCHGLWYGCHESVWHGEVSAMTDIDHWSTAGGGGME